MQKENKVVSDVWCGWKIDYKHLSNNCKKHIVVQNEDPTSGPPYWIIYFSSKKYGPPLNNKIEVYDDEVTLYLNQYKSDKNVTWRFDNSYDIRRMAKKFTISNKKNRGPERDPEGNKKGSRIWVQKEVHLFVPTQLYTPDSSKASSPTPCTRRRHNSKGKTV